MFRPLPFALVNVMVQLSTPRWVLGRTLSIYHTASSGGMTAGGRLWGTLAKNHGAPFALMIAGGVAVVGAAIRQLCRQQPVLKMSALTAQHRSCGFRHGPSDRWLTAPGSRTPFIPRRAVSATTGGRRRSTVRALMPLITGGLDRLNRFWGNRFTPTCVAFRKPLVRGMAHIRDGGWTRWTMARKIMRHCLSGPSLTVSH